MKIITDPEKCTGCKICVRICPQKILEVINEKMSIIDENRCMGCFGCEDECEAGAVRLLRAPQNCDEIAIEPEPEGITECDVAIVGAGPAGLGAAITCARAGLKTVVFERLPNRKISHHTDGGVLFSFPGMTSIQVDGSRVVFPELDISITANFTRQCHWLGLLGPNGLSTGNDFPKGIQAWAGNKDGFVEALVNEAEAKGATIWYNAKVVDVIKADEQVAGVKLENGKTIHSKVVITADGVFARISEKAGMEICKEDLWYGNVLAYEFANENDLPGGLYYLNGEMQWEPDMPVAFGGIGVTEVIHVLIAFFSRRKHYPAPKPMDYYVRKLVDSDQRVHQILGDGIIGKQPELLTGCRAPFRKRANTNTVGNGVISIGDAWVDDGEIGNVPALANGVHAGRVIIAAAEKNDFTAKALQPANKFLTKKLLRALSKNKEMKILPARISEEEMEQLFRFMQHLNYPLMMFGSPWQQGLMFSRFMIKNFFRFFKYPKIAKSMF